MIWSLRPLTVKGEIKRVSNDFVPLASGPGEGKQKQKQQGKEKINLLVLTSQTVRSHQK
jgi:hypothetical protein